MEFSADQKYALDVLLSWFTKPKRNYITLGGFAGTGKTTLIAKLRGKISKVKPKTKVAFVSYTGKASQILKHTLQESNVIKKGDFVGTIHSLIYSPLVDTKTQEIIGWQQKDKIDYDLIIIDEASMVNEYIWQDIRSYNIPIIAVGDHGQLPPIQGNFSLMQKPDIKLESIHRQAAKSPIIRLSTLARTEGKIPIGNYGQTVIKYGKSDSEIYSVLEKLLERVDQDTMILCGYNHTRVKLNKQIRSNLGFESDEPAYYDKVICLKNNHKKQIFNGEIGFIEKIKEENGNYNVVITMEDEMYYQGIILKEQFNSLNSLNQTQDRYKVKDMDLFDFGYAITVHKAQGSQAKRVILFEEKFAKMDDEMWRRWLYTAVTRAQKELYIIG